MSTLLDHRKSACRPVEADEGADLGGRDWAQARVAEEGHVRIGTLALTVNELCGGGGDGGGGEQITRKINEDRI